MTMDVAAFESAVDEVVVLYHAICEYHKANPEERVVISGMFGRMLDVAMDHFLHDIDNVHMDAVKIMLRRTVLTEKRIAELARENINPYNRPVTREELLAETPGMIPLLLARAVLCWRFHYMPVYIQHIGPSWDRFAKNYISKLPTG